MNKEIISDKQGIILVMLFILGSTLVVGTGGEAKKDMWLAVIIGIAFSLLMLMIYAKLLSMFPEKDIFDILKLVFGNFIGKAISLLFIWYALHLGSLVLYNFSEFIVTVGLEETPRVVPVSVIMLLCAWGVKEGIEVLGRWGEIMFPFLFIIIFLSTVLSIPNMRLNNVLPILEGGIKPVIKGALFTFSFPFTETVIFIMFLSCLKGRKSIFKAFLLGLLIAGSILTVIAARNIMVLGAYILSLSYYPSFNTIARINTGHFLQRLESAISIVFLIAGYIKISMCLLGASKGISKLFNLKDYRFIVIPTALLILNLSFLVSKDMMESVKWNIEVYRPYASIFEVILPSLIFICAKIRYKKIHNNDLSNV
jgi:spore germination protein KB